MPPKKTKVAKAAPTLTVSCFSRGSGMTAGLEIWSTSLGGAPIKFLMYDRSPDGRFAGDVIPWNSATGLTPALLARFITAVA
jgi:hypothetical protein